MRSRARTGPTDLRLKVGCPPPPGVLRIAGPGPKEFFDFLRGSSLNSWRRFWRVALAGAMLLAMDALRASCCRQVSSGKLLPFKGLSDIFAAIATEC